MDISKLHIFLSVVDAGSFSKAAEKLGYTQAGISYIVNKVEKDLGISLLERDFNGIKLNADGEALIGEIRKTVDAAQVLESAVRGRNAKKNAKIRIGAVDTIATKWLPGAAARFQEEFQKEFPKIQVDILTGTPFEINDWLAEDIVDIGLTEKLWSANNYHWIPFDQDFFYGVFPPKTAVENPFPLKFFEGRTFILSDYRQDRNVPIFLKEHNINVEFLYDKVSAPSVIGSIAAGRGCSILSALAIHLSGYQRQQDLQPVIVPLSPPLYRELGAAVKPERKEEPALKAFARCMRGLIGEKDDWKTI